MIEEIVLQGILPSYQQILVIFVPTLTVSFIGLFTMIKSVNLGIVITLVSICIAVTLTSFFAISDGQDKSEWLEQVHQQVESLQCQDLEDAYEIYKLEFIKEKFLFECVDTREGWWK